MNGRAVFLGSKAFGLSILDALIDAEPGLSWSVVHPDDRRDDRSVMAAFESFCEARQISFSVAPRSRDANARIAEHAPDIVFVCGWYHLIPADVLSAGPRFFGIHNSLLPRYRGGAPLVWALMRGERMVGSTLFALGGGMDDGRVFLQVSTEVGEEDGIGDVLGAIEARFVAALADGWPAIVHGSNPGSEQDHASATYCAQRIPEDGRIDWRLTARQVHDFVRAQSHPYPGAFTHGPEGMVRIWRTRVSPAAYCGTPGQVLERRDDEIIVSCGEDSAIAILDASGAEGETSLVKLFPSIRTRLGAPRAVVDPEIGEL